MYGLFSAIIVAGNYLDATVSIGPSLCSVTAYQTKLLVDIFNLEFIEY